MTNLQSAQKNSYPEPRNKHPSSTTKEDLLRRLKAGERSGRDFLCVDVRRNDYEGGTVQGSLNLPAESLYHTLPSLLELCRNAGVKQVIFYCGSCGSRGPRAAGWFDDLLVDQGVMGIESVILQGGIKGWAGAGGEYVKYMDAYDPAHWQKAKS